MNTKPNVAVVTGVGSEHGIGFQIVVGLLKEFNGIVYLTCKFFLLFLHYKKNLIASNILKLIKIFDLSKLFQ
jgi:hypothetical protein